jgi:hypothetical protein
MPSHRTLPLLKSSPSRSSIYSVLPVCVLYRASIVPANFTTSHSVFNQYFALQDDIPSSVQLSDRSTAVQAFRTVLHSRPTAIDALPIRSYIFSICHDVGREVCDEQHCGRAFLSVGVDCLLVPATVLSKDFEHAVLAAYRVGYSIANRGCGKHNHWMERVRESSSWNLLKVSLFI